MCPIGGTKQKLPTTGCLIKGNIGKSGKIYHVPGSRWYDRTKIDERKGERWFCNASEAEQTGRRPLN